MKLNLVICPHHQTQFILNRIISFKETPYQRLQIYTLIQASLMCIQANKRTKNSLKSCFRFSLFDIIGLTNPITVISINDCKSTQKRLATGLLFRNNRMIANDILRSNQAHGNKRAQRPLYLKFNPLTMLPNRSLKSLSPFIKRSWLFLLRQNSETKMGQTASNTLKNRAIRELATSPPFFHSKLQRRFKPEQTSRKRYVSSKKLIQYPKNNHFLAFYLMKAK